MFEGQLTSVLNKVLGAYVYDVSAKVREGEEAALRSRDALPAPLIQRDESKSASGGAAVKLRHFGDARFLQPVAHLRRA